MDNNEKLTQIFADALVIDKSIVTDSLKYQSIAQWDSVSHMVLISAIEESFNISLDTQDVIDMSSVAKAKEILGKYKIAF